MPNLLQSIGLPAIVTPSIPSLLDSAVQLIVRGSRAIGFIIPQVTLEEHHRDTLMITDHPVERGAVIQDHAFRWPCEVEMRVAWSDAGTAPGYVKIVYEALLNLKDRRQPFDVVTGKRNYRNMLIQTLGVTTDRHTENALMVVCRLREIIITDTQAGSGFNSASSAANQAMPEKTTPLQNAGTKLLQDVSRTANFSSGIQSAIGFIGVG